MDTGLERRRAALVSAAAFVLYAATASRTIGFGDSPELIAAAQGLGVAHPPGYPLYTLLGWIAIWFPLGEPALRMNLMSAVFGALGVGGVYFVMRRWAASVAASLAAAGALCTSSSYWYASIVAEVYSLHVLLVIALLGAASELRHAADVGPPRPAAAGRALLVGATALGLGLAHHPTIVLAVPAAACLAIGLDPRSLRGIGALVPRAKRAIALGLVIALPVIFYTSLPWRARAAPEASWGSVTELEALLAHVGALTFRHLDLGWVALVDGARWAAIGRGVGREMGWIVLPLAAVGLAGAALPRGGRRIRAALVALIVAGTIFGLRYDVEDVSVFMLPAFVGLACAAGLGVDLAARLSARRSVAVVLAVTLVGWTLGANLGARSMRGVTAARDWAEDALRTVPHDGVLLVRSLESFGLLYLTRVLGQRPDVAIYHRNGTVFDDLLDSYAVEPWPDESPWAYRVRVEQAFVDRTLRSNPPRAVMFLGWPGYDVPDRYRIEPIGLLHRIRPAFEPPTDVDAVWAGYREHRVERQARRIGDPLALDLAATYALARAERAYAEYDPARAHAALDEAIALSGDDAGILSYIGTVHGRHGEFGRAIAVLERAVAARPTSYAAWNNLALAREAAGDLDGAREALRRSLAVAAGQAAARENLRRLESNP